MFNLISSINNKYFDDIIIKDAMSDREKKEKILSIRSVIIGETS